MTKENLIELGIDENIADKVIELIKADEKAVLSAHNDVVANLAKEKEDLLVGYEISRAIAAAGVWSEKAVYALFDLNNITVKNGKVSGVGEEISRIKNEYGILFKDTAIPKVISSRVGNAEIPDKAIRTAMGI